MFDDVPPLSSLDLGASRERMRFSTQANGRRSADIEPTVLRFPRDTCSFVVAPLSKDVDQLVIAPNEGI